MDYDVANNPHHIDHVDLSKALVLSDNTKLMNLAHHVFWAMAENSFKVAIGETTISVYNPKMFPHVQQIANMFNIDIQGEDRIVANALLEYPIYSKANLGTIGGVTKSLESILQNINIRTHDNDPNLPAYVFKVQADNTAGLDQKKAIELINRFACLRDNTPVLELVSIICEEPIILFSIIKTFRQVQLDFDKGECRADYELSDADSPRS